MRPPIASPKKGRPPEDGRPLRPNETTRTYFINTIFFVSEKVPAFNR